MDSKTKYLIVKGSGGGGLGDRIRSVLTGIAYAKLANRTIFIDWSDGKLIPQRRNVFFEIFHLNNIDYVRDCPVSDDVLPLIWQGKLDLSLHDQYQESKLVNWDRQAAIELFSFDQRRLDYPQQILVMWEFDQLASFSSHYAPGPDNSLMKYIAAQHLCVNEQILTEVQHYKQQTYLGQEKIIAVHIRATVEFQRQKYAVKLDHYLWQINRCLRHLNGQAKIFLATDNLDMENQLKAAFPGQVCTRNKWFADPGEKIHFNEQCPDADKSLQDAIIEICLLADSEYLIYQYNSSFGMIAHYLFKADDKNVFALVPSFGLLGRLKCRLKKYLNAAFNKTHSQ